MRRCVGLFEKLVIVESPNKVIKVEGLLSDPKVVSDWSFGLAPLKKIGMGPEKSIAMATTGHFMSLKELTWTPQEMKGTPADDDFPANGVLASFALEWEVIPGRHIQETVSHYIQEKADNLSEIIIATDPDREGELIAIHALNLVRSMFPDVKVPFTRAYMHSITADGIRAAMKQRQEVFDYNLANAAEARHAMDRIFGFLGSSVVRYANPQMRSIGRVQTPALILIAERERRIAQFLASHKTSFEVRAECSFRGPAGASYTQIVTVKPRMPDSGNTRWDNIKDVTQLAAKWRIENAGGFSLAQQPVVTPSETHPPEPFTMATLIARANRQLRLTSESVSSCLQDLFQMGYITYPRTDSSRIDEAALTAIYAAVSSEYGKVAVNKLEDRTTGGGKRKPKAAEKQPAAAEGNVEDAHEAIRPTDITLTAEALGNGINDSTKQVYDLIRRNTLAAFMSPMKTERVVAELHLRGANGDELSFTLEGKHTVEPGWSQAFRTGSGKAMQAVAESQLDAEAAESGTVVVPSISNEEFNAIVGLPSVLGSGKAARSYGKTTGSVKLSEGHVLENKPSPPLPYSEGGLIEELKNNGVGRPSTYPMIVKTLLARNYITVNKGRCETTEVGRMLVETSKTTFPSIVDIGFTSSFERKLDRIAKPQESDNTFLANQNSITEADYVLSSFVSKFLNYVTDATRLQRANIAERSATLKREQHGAVAESSDVKAEIQRDRQRAAASVPDLLDSSRNYRTFTALQNSLNDYLRRNFPQSPGVRSYSSNGSSAGGSQSFASRKRSSRSQTTSFTQYAKKITSKPKRAKTGPRKLKK